MKYLYLTLLVLLTGCASAQSIPNDQTDAPPEPVEERTSFTVMPKFYEYPEKYGVRYPTSEQFALCRQSDHCDVPRIPRMFQPERPAASIGAEKQTQFIKAILALKKLPFTRMAEVHFGFGSPEARSFEPLNQLLLQIKGTNHNLLRVVIAGFTDSTGSESSNKKLSEERVNQVSTYLQENGIDTKIITTVARPLCCYISPNDTPEGRASNRRVEVWVEPIVEEGAHAN